MSEPSKSSSRTPSPGPDDPGSSPAWADLPGAELVRPGLEDLQAGAHETAEALLVSMAATRLRELGVLEGASPRSEHPHLALFELLQAEAGQGAHARYLALEERLASFLRAREQQLLRDRPSAA